MKAGYTIELILTGACVCIWKSLQENYMPIATNFNELWYLSNCIRDAGFVLLCVSYNIFLESETIIQLSDLLKCSVHIRCSDCKIKLQRPFLCAPKKMAKLIQTKAGQKLRKKCKQMNRMMKIHYNSRLFFNLKLTEMQMKKLRYEIDYLRTWIILMQHYTGSRNILVNKAQHIKSKLVLNLFQTCSRICNETPTLHFSTICTNFVQNYFAEWGIQRQMLLKSQYVLPSGMCVKCILRPIKSPQSILQITTSSLF